MRFIIRFAFARSSMCVNSLLFLLLSFGPAPSAPAAEEHAHEHGAAKVAKPRVFLDKSRAIVDYQLRRLSNEQLLLVDRATDDPKYVPVYAAILSRPAVAPAIRKEALAGLVAIQKANPVAVLLEAIGNVKGEADEVDAVVADLASLLLRQSPEALAGQREQFEQAAGEAESPSLRRAALAALLTTQPGPAVWKLAGDDPARIAELLSAVGLVPKQGRRAALRGRVLALLAEDQPNEVRRAAVAALAFIPASKGNVFEAVAPLFAEASVRQEAVRTMLAIPKAQRPVAQCEPLVAKIIDYAATVPIEQRTSDEFLDVMQLADELLARLPEEKARSGRAALGEYSVRVVRINTVLEEMRYEETFFAAEAGKPIQIILRNEDLMPHNLVVVKPGTMKEIGMLASKMEPPTDGNPLQYIPDSPDVLFPGEMCPPDKQVRLTFTVPSEPGEYPYVCTFPNHWFRMYGVMVVVPDLVAWQKNPTKPADPLGLSREIVQNWKPEDFAADLSTPTKHDFAAGQAIYNEAGCAKCHKVRNEGGVVGPDLTEVFERHKGSHEAVLLEMLDPSNKIVEQYAVYSIITLEGRVLTGIIKAQDDDSISLLTNPESTTAETILREEIDEMICTKTSMMPKALLDRFTKEEILSLLAYLEAGGDAGHAVYRP